MTELQIYDEALRLLQEHSQVDFGATAQAHSKNFSELYDKIHHSNFGDQNVAAVDRVRREIFAAGPIERLFLDPDITEIIINGHDSVWVEKLGCLKKIDDQFISSASYSRFLQRLQIEANVQADLNHPYADGYWRGYRLHLILPPLTIGDARLTLRRHPTSPWTLDALEKLSWAPKKEVSFLRELVKSRAALLVVGATSSGKTSVLNACLQEVSRTERVVTIEDTNEIELPNQASTKLLTRHDLNGNLKTIDQSELLRQALRMRPDRIVVGEVRGDEARDLLMAFSTGHRGGLGTLHAENARQALMRLEMLVQMGAPHWSLRAIRHLIFFGFQYILTVAKTSRGRKLTGVYKISSLEDHGHCLEPIFELGAYD